MKGLVVCENAVKYDPVVPSKIVYAGEVHVVKIVIDMGLVGGLSHVCANLADTVLRLCVALFSVAFLRNGVLSCKGDICRVDAHWAGVKRELHEACFDDQEQPHQPVALHAVQDVFECIFVHAL